MPSTASTTGEAECAHGRHNLIEKKQGTPTEGLHGRVQDSHHQNHLRMNSLSFTLTTTQPFPVVSQVNFEKRICSQVDAPCPCEPARVVAHLNLCHSNYEWKGCKDPAPQNFKITHKALSLPLTREVVIWTTCWRLEAMGEQRRTKKKREKNDFNQK